VRPLDRACSWRRARRVTPGALLVADEVQCGLAGPAPGRPAARRVSRQNLVTLAKPLAAGLPLGALLGREDLAAESRPRDARIDLRRRAAPLRVALAFLDAVESEGSSRRPRAAEIS